jgi:hypothetical protein
LHGFAAHAPKTPEYILGIHALFDAQQSRVVGSPKRLLKIRLVRIALHRQRPFHQSRLGIPHSSTNPCSAQVASEHPGPQPTDSTPAPAWSGSKRPIRPPSLHPSVVTQRTHQALTRMHITRPPSRMHRVEIRRKLMRPRPRNNQHRPTPAGTPSLTPTPNTATDRPTPTHSARNSPDLDASAPPCPGTCSQ